MQAKNGTTPLKEADLPPKIRNLEIQSANLQNWDLHNCTAWSSTQNETKINGEAISKKSLQR